MLWIPNEEAQIETTVDISFAINFSKPIIFLRTHLPHALSFFCPFYRFNLDYSVNFSDIKKRHLINGLQTVYFLHRSERIHFESVKHDIALVKRYLPECFFFLFWFSITRANWKKEKQINIKSFLFHFIPLL